MKKNPNKMAAYYFLGIFHTSKKCKRLTILTAAPPTPDGSFLEYDDQNMDALRAIVTRKYQTLSYIGFKSEELREWVRSNGLPGIDKVVRVGRTTDFGPIWDGYDLISFLSRICEVQ